MDLGRDIQFLKGVGPKKASAFNKIGIETIRDLLFFYPRDFMRITNMDKQQNLQDKEKVYLTGYVVEPPFLKKVKQNLSYITTSISTDNGRYKIIIFNRPYLLNKLKTNISVAIQGNYSKKYNQITVSELSFKNSGHSKTGNNAGLVPIYKSTEDLSQKQIRDAITIAIDKYLFFVDDPLPDEFLLKYNLEPLKTALKYLHFPEDEEQFNRARYRLIFEELIVFQSALLYSKKKLEQNLGFQHLFPMDKISSFYRSLSFNLTEDQQRVIEEVLKDMASNKPMNRLIQGDVGSGKTIIATVALLACALSGGQGVFLAPTEILAEQHYNNLKAVLDYYRLNIVLLTSSSANKTEIYRQIGQNEADIVIGTHAILQQKVEFKNLSLIVTDEQHRFGVKQRASLRKKGAYPDVLVMSATPIPRTLSQVLYGDLEISIIKQMPSGRKPILTYSVSPKSRQKVYDFIKKELAKGRQCYIICPLIEESEKVMGESAITYHEKIQGSFSGCKVGLLHGQMRPREKDEVMHRFKQGEFSILVSTTVVEVGVDVPNSSVIVIENAEKFGLAQLHQLRGRVGRSSYQSYCILVSHTSSEITNKRMHVMTSTTDGFKISEEDLKLRGPGEFFGIRQHGLPEFKYFNLLSNVSEVPKAKEAAFFLLSKQGDINYNQIFDKISTFYDNYLD